MVQLGDHGDRGGDRHSAERDEQGSERQVVSAQIVGVRRSILPPL
jgi:hypothetical protein